MRTKANEMQYMNSMDAWLNQANYDKYAYLLEEKKGTDYENEDWK